MTKTEIIRTIAEKPEHLTKSIFHGAIVEACKLENKPFDYTAASNKVDKLSILRRMISDCDMLIQRYESYQDDTTWNEPISVETSKREIYLSEFKKVIEEL